MSTLIKNIYIYIFLINVDTVYVTHHSACCVNIKMQNVFSPYIIPSNLINIVYNCINMVNGPI